MAANGQTSISRSRKEEYMYSEIKEMEQDASNYNLCLNETSSSNYVLLSNCECDSSIELLQALG